MIAMLDECGLILERRKLRAEKQAAEMETQREQLRANLLRAISHDLRTTADRHQRQRRYADGKKRFSE